MPALASLLQCFFHPTRPGFLQEALTDFKCFVSHLAEERTRRHTGKQRLPLSPPPTVFGCTLTTPPNPQTPVHHQATCGDLAVDPPLGFATLPCFRNSSPRCPQLSAASLHPTHRALQGDSAVPVIFSRHQGYLYLPRSTQKTVKSPPAPLSLA